MNWGSHIRFESVCTVAVLVIGLVTCIAASRKLGWGTLGLAGLVLLAAHGGDMLGPRTCVWWLLERGGYWESLRKSTVFLGTWTYGWRLLPVVLTAVFAWVLYVRTGKGVRPV
jgi:membrane protease YdiL (CAAX protease family)